MMRGSASSSPRKGGMDKPSFDFQQLDSEQDFTDSMKPIDARYDYHDQASLLDISPTGARHEAIRAAALNNLSKEDARTILARTRVRPNSMAGLRNRAHRKVKEYYDQNPQLEKPNTYDLPQPPDRPKSTPTLEATFKHHPEFRKKLTVPQVKVLEAVMKYSHTLGRFQMDLQQFEFSETCWQVESLVQWTASRPTLKDPEAQRQLQSYHNTLQLVMKSLRDSILFHRSSYLFPIEAVRQELDIKSADSEAAAMNQIDTGLYTAADVIDAELKNFKSTFADATKKSSGLFGGKRSRDDSDSDAATGEASGVKSKTKRKRKAKAKAKASKDKVADNAAKRAKATSTKVADVDKARPKAGDGKTKPSGDASSPDDSSSHSGRRHSGAPSATKPDNSSKDGSKHKSQRGKRGSGKGKTPVKSPKAQAAGAAANKHKKRK